jgi:hypothetical protein
MFFSGLMVAKPDAAGSDCEIFVHKTALAHELSLEIRLKKPNRPDEIVMRHLGPLELLTDPSSAVRYGFIVTTNEAKGVKAYRGAATTEVDPIERVFDLNVFHPGRTRVHAEGAQPSIFMNDALFYCAEKTVPGLEVELQLTQTGAKVTDLNEFSSILGANIYANGVNVAWREKGAVQAFPLTNNIPAGAHYEIYVINDPAYQPLPPVGAQPHDELGEYYKILPDVQPNEKLKLFFKKIPGQNPATPVAAQDKGSNRIPCMTVIDTGA